MLGQFRYDGFGVALELLQWHLACEVYKRAIVYNYSFRQSWYLSHH